MSECKVLRKLTIRELLEKRYTIEQIVKETGIPQSTIYKHMAKFKRESYYWFNTLAEKDFIPEYKSIMDSLDHSIKRCYEQLDKIDIVYNDLIKNTKTLMEATEGHKGELYLKVELNAKIAELEENRLKEQKDYIKLIQDFEVKKSQALHKAPMILSIETAIKRKSLQPEPTPTLKALEYAQAEAKQ